MTCVTDLHLKALHTNVASMLNLVTFIYNTILALNVICFLDLANQPGEKILRFQIRQKVTHV